jgi:putative nucleotidyltransferase with HDIG domain
MLTKTDQPTALIISNDRATIQAGLCSMPGGQSATVAYDLSSALTQIAHSNFDVILSEIRLPEMCGLELLARLQSAAPDAGIVFVFSSREWSLALDAMRGGAYDCLEKPARADSWRSRLQEVLRRRRSEQDQRMIQQLLESTLKERTDHLQRALDEVEASRRDTMEALVTALDKREHATHLHSLRVQAFTMVLAEHCGYNPAGIQGLSYGALLHDIGKIAIPDTIILKPGPLTHEEAHIMRQHPELGYQILSRIPHLEEAAEIALRHHERVDGLGYPFGLRGEEVPLSVRIFSIADALDVILSGRSYCTPRTLEAARIELLRCAGEQFDPEIVDVFLDVPHEEWFEAQKLVNTHAAAQQYQPVLTLQ